MLKGRIRFFINKDKTAADIMAAVDKKLYPKLQRRVLILAPAVATVFDKFIKETDEWKSLLRKIDAGTKDSLATNLGIRGRDTIVWLSNILEVWKQSITARIEKQKSNKGRLRYRIIFEGIRADYSDVLSLPYASYLSQKSGSRVEWLRWLLLEADSVKIIDYEIFFDDIQQSRTGDAIMIPTKKGFWQLPDKFRKPASQNFVTEVIESSNFETVLRAKLLKLITDLRI